MKIRGRIGAGNTVVDLTMVDGLITDQRPADRSVRCDLGDPSLRIAPGWIDLQINGYNGVDFNFPETTVEEIEAATRALKRTGVTAFCPTIITGSTEQIDKCISNLVRAAEQSTEVARSHPGIHLEGPFISPEDGPRGAHPREHVSPPDWDRFRRWQETARGKIGIVTLSPEWPEATGLIERLVEAGVIAAIGHTAASPQQIADAVRAGAKLSTHLGNGSHARIDRHPNYIWEQLATDDLWASLIVDGHHLPPSVVKCFLRCKTPGRTILVTDAIAAAGRPSGRYRLGAVEVELTPTRRVCLPGTPYLAGSALEMQEAVAKTVAFSDATLDDALQMASGNPARILGLSDKYGSIAPGFSADLVLFDWDDQTTSLEIEATIVDGQIAYRRNRQD